MNAQAWRGWIIRLGAGGVAVIVVAASVVAWRMRRDCQQHEAALKRVGQAATARELVRDRTDLSLAVEEEERELRSLQQRLARLQESPSPPKQALRLDRLDLLNLAHGCGLRMREMKPLGPLEPAGRRNDAQENRFLSGVPIGTLDGRDLVEIRCTGRFDDLARFAEALGAADRSAVPVRFRVRRAGLRTESAAAGEEALLDLDLLLVL